MAMKLVLEVGGRSYQVAVSAVENVYTVDLPSGRFTLDVRRASSGHALSLINDGESLEAWAVPTRGAYHVQVLGKSYDIEVEDALRAKLKRLEAGGESRQREVIRAPMPGVVVELMVSEGQAVEAGTPVVIVEAMKMRNEFSAKISGIVGKIYVVPGQTVERNSELCVVVPTADEAAS
jgi:biotin carboxyl carrier protein